MKINDFADIMDLSITIKRRANRGKLLEYYAYFESVDIVNDVMLCGKFGNGDTPSYAILDYCKQIQGQRLVFAAHSKIRREFNAPPELTI